MLRYEGICMETLRSHFIAMFWLHPGHFPLNLILTIDAKAFHWMDRTRIMADLPSCGRLK